MTNYESKLEETLKRNKATFQAAEEVYDTPYDELPQTVTLKQHVESSRDFRLAVSKAFPDMTNKQADALMDMAHQTYWPGITTWVGRLHPAQIAEEVVKQRAEEILARD